MEESGAPQPALRMFTTTQDYQEISGKLTKLFKLQVDGLAPPTFTPIIIEKFSKILHQAKTAQTQNKSSNPSDFVSIMAPFVPKIVELSSQHFLQRTIRDTQVMVSKLIKAVNSFSENLTTTPENKAPIVRIASELKSLMPKALLISFSKAAPSTFNAMQQTVHTIQADLMGIRDSSIAAGYEQFSSLITLSSELECSIKHLIAAHGFVAIAESLQNSLRHFTFEESIKSFPLHNRHVRLHPCRPKPFTFGKVPEMQESSELLEEFLKNNKSDDQFIPKFQAALQKEFQFDSCTPAVADIVFVILTIQPPQDPTKKVFTKCSNFFFAASKIITQLYKLPDYAYSLSEISPFMRALENLKQSSDSIIKARKKPVGWSAQDTKDFMKCTEPIIKLESILSISLDLVERANEAVGKNVFRVHISHLLPKPISHRFVIFKQVKSPVLEHFNIIRGLSLVAQRIADLREKGVIMRTSTNDEDALVLHPVDFSAVFDRIRKNINKIEEDLFHMSLDQYNEFPSAKSGVTMVSALAEISRKLEEYILCMNLVPLEIAGIRELSMILYEQGFPLSSDSIFTDINRDLNILFEVYQIFELLDLSGSVDLSSCVQMSFYATMLTELCAQWPEFSQNAEYFRNLNLFELDLSDILFHISEFKDYGTRELMKWACADQLARFTKEYKSTYTAATIMRSQPLESVLSKLLAQLTTMLITLPKNAPKQNNLREMNLRMQILKKMMIQYLDNHPECPCTTQFEQIFNPIDQIKQLWASFSAKAKLKTIITFSERINTGDEIEEASSEDTSIPIKSLEVAVEETNFDVSQTSFTEEEKKLWPAFAAMVFSVEQVPVHPQFPSYTEELVHRRVRTVFEEFKEEWSTELIFTKEYAEINDAISQPSYVNQTLYFSKFNEKVTFSLELQLDVLLAQLIEFNPPSRGRGYPREFPPHPRAPQIGELSKMLQVLKNNLSNTDFAWLTDLLNCRSVAYNIFRAIDVTNDQSNPLITIRSLTNKAFAFFRLTRCLLFAKGGLPTFDPDLKMLKVLVSGLFEKTRFVQEKSPLLFHEIDQVLKSNVINNFSNLVSSVKVLSRSRAIFDIKELVTTADLDFFCFPDYFKKLPSNSASLASFLDSTVYEIFATNKQIVTLYVSSKFSSRFVIDQFRLRIKFKNDFNMSPIPINWERTDVNISTLFSLQQLIDISRNFDLVFPLVQAQSDQMISGTQYLAIELLVIELQNQIESLVQSKPSRLCKVYINLTKVLTAMKNVPAKFGPRKITNDYLIAFKNEWIDFIENFKRLPMSDFLEEFRHLSNKIIDVLQDNPTLETHKEVKSLLFLVKQYEVISSKEILMKLKFSFDFIAAQISRAKNGSDNISNDLPFFQLQVIINAMLSMYTICELIPLITQAFEDAFKCTISHCVPSISEDEKEDTVVKQIYQQVEPKTHLEKPLSLFEQTCVGHMAAGLFDANMAAQETIVAIQLHKRAVEREQITIQNARSSNQELKVINECLQKCIQSQEEAQRNTNGKSAEELAKIDEDIILEMEKEQKVQRSKHHLDIVKKQYEMNIDSIKECAETKIELEKSLVILESREERNACISKLNRFDEQILALSKSSLNWDHDVKEALDEQ